MRTEARARGGDVIVRGEFPVIEGDDVLLRQAFSNLLRNAVEACVDASTAPKIIVDGRVEGGSVRVTVDDNGPGVPPLIASACSGRSSRRRDAEQASVSRWCRKSSSRITAESRSRPRLQAGRAFRLLLPLPSGADDSVILCAFLARRPQTTILKFSL